MANCDKIPLNYSAVRLKSINKMKLLLIAENYAFGPIGKLLSIAEHLKLSKHSLSFAGYGTAFQLANHFKFDQIFEIDTEDKKQNKKFREIIQEFDALIICMDLPSLIVGQNLGKPTVWIDSLFWFWDKIPDSMLKADLYIKENSIDEDRKRQKYAKHIKNLVEVGPIIGKVNKQRRKNQAMISFGGGEATHLYEVGKNSNYPFVMTKILSEIESFNEFKSVSLYTNETIVKMLKKKFPKKIIHFDTLSHENFLTELNGSELFLTTPGLGMTLESMYCETPTILLPASNDSQYLQLDQFREKGLAKASVGLQDFLAPLALAGIPVEKSTKKMLKQMKTFEKSATIQQKVGSEIKKLIESRDVWSNEYVSRGNIFLKSLGGNGSLKAANEILSFLDSFK